VALSAFESIEKIKEKLGKKEKCKWNYRRSSNCIAYGLVGKRQDHKAEQRKAYCNKNHSKGKINSEFTA